jgi:superfamily II DNA or RNA helicase
MGDLNRPKMINNICSCEKRNQIILEEVNNLMSENRKVLILSDRKEHLKYLMEQIEIKFGDIYYVEPETIQEPILVIEPVKEPVLAIKPVEKNQEIIEEIIEETIQEKKKREKEENKIKEREEKKRKKLEEKEEKKRKEKEEKEEQKRKDIEDGIDVFLGKTKLHGKICGLYVGGMKQTDLKISEDKRIILGTYPMVSEGFDCPTLDSVILASPKSDVIQSVGRIMRKKPEDRDRQHLVIDIIDYFGNFAQQWETRKKYYKKQKYQFDEYSYDDNSVRTVVTSGAPPPRKHKTFKEEIQEVDFIDNDNDDDDDDNLEDDDER